MRDSAVVYFISTDLFKDPAGRQNFARKGASLHGQVASARTRHRHHEREARTRTFFFRYIWLGEGMGNDELAQHGEKKSLEERNHSI